MEHWGRLWFLSIHALWVHILVKTSCRRGCGSISGWRIRTAESFGRTSEGRCYTATTTRSSFGGNSTSRAVRQRRSTLQLTGGQTLISEIRRVVREELFNCLKNHPLFLRSRRVGLQQVLDNFPDWASITTRSRTGVLVRKALQTDRPFNVTLLCAAS